jgi:hypothetical protein
LWAAALSVVGHNRIVADGRGYLAQSGGDHVAWFHDPDGNTLSLTTFTGA